MAFTYTGKLETDLEKVRLEIGDTVAAEELFSDAEVEYKLKEESDVVVAAAELCSILARRFARAFDFETDGQAFKRSQMSKAYAQQAKELRQRSAAGFSTLPTTRTDGYSQDVDYSQSDATSSRRGRVRAGWFDPDLPR